MIAITTSLQFLTLRKVLSSYGKGNGHIFNLGHGILPDIDPENVKVLVDYVKNESKNFHNS